MDVRSRSAGAGLSPGTDPLALRLVTAVVLAGLIATVAGVLALGGGGSAPVAQTADGRPAAGPSQAAGLKLLAAAARACRSVPYEGVEVLAWWGPRGSSTAVVDVWHRKGGRTLAKASTSTPEWPRERHQAVLFTGPGHSMSAAGNGVLGMTRRLVSLLGANYELAVAGRGEVVGRPARIVTVRRSDGSLAARFWLDNATGLPLRRQMFGTGATLVSDVVFAQVTFVRGPLTSLPASAAQPWGDTLTSAQLARLRARGWLLPGPMPGKLTLLSASETSTSSGPVVDLDYSDGLSVISVFVQRGHLPTDLSGWSRVAMEGHEVYADDAEDLSVTWSARGFVYTVIAAAPEQTVERVVAALPHDEAPGILGRIRRGLRRLLSWASP